MSVLEVWQVNYREDDEAKSQSFNYYDLEGLKKFVATHDAIEVLFKATGLPESSTHRVNSKDVLQLAVPIEDVPTLTPEWINRQRKQY
jgi:hypothetical protein